LSSGKHWVVVELTKEKIVRVGRISTYTKYFY